MALIFRTRYKGKKAQYLRKQAGAHGGADGLLEGARRKRSVG